MRMKKAWILLVAAMIMLFSTIPAAAAGKEFSDVKQGSWYYKAVMSVVDRGLFNGNGKGLFEPQGEMTRAMFAQVLANYTKNYKAPASSSTPIFTDVRKGDWYFKAVQWAAKSGIVSGTGDRKFAPNRKISREEMVTMLYRYAQNTGENTATSGRGLEAFNDRNHIASWAKSALSWAVSNGIISGKNGGMLAPKDTATRAEAATMFSRTYKIITKREIAEKEMRGAWVPYMSLITTQKTKEAFRQNFMNIVNQSKKTGINTLFVHVRPFSDALYESSYFPWSHVVTGKQGQNPGYDPLEIMIECAHTNGLEIHAWINPLRIKSATVPTALSSNGVYEKLKNKNPEYFMHDRGAIYLNPAYKYARDLITNGVVEIVKKYDVDGIHFDDYLYPHGGSSAMDATAYDQYKKTTSNPMPLVEWRKGNINTLVRQVYSSIKKADSSMPFGISPIGNITLTDILGADVKTWCSTPGYIDYLCPQVYYSYTSPVLGFTPALNTWLALEKHPKLKMYIGLALYKAGMPDSDTGTWVNYTDILKRQVEDSRKVGTDGTILYSTEYLTRPEAQKEIANLKKAWNVK
jgi:Uncharacterized protein conserved in bacteria